MNEPPIVVTLKLDERKLPELVFEQCVKRSGLIESWRTRSEEARENFGKPGRDPNRIGGVMEAFAMKQGWGSYLNMTRIMAAWPEIVGDPAARYTQVDSVVDGVLKIRATTPSWEQQMMSLSYVVLTRMQQQHPEFGIRKIEVMRAPKRRGTSRLKPMR